MIWVRRVILSFLSLILFISLLATAFSTSADIAFKNPSKIESWLNKSNLYSHFVSNTVNESIKAAGSSLNQSSLAYTAVQEAAASSFTTSLFQNSVNTVLNSNYSWLEGKTSKPSFTVNLSSAKNNFADQVGKYVEDQIKSLPACSAAQLVGISNVDPLNATCLPPGINAHAEASLVTQKIESSSDFLSNPVITPDNINPSGSHQTHPYYQRFSKAPQAYKLIVKLPWIYGLIALLSTLGVIFLAPRKRKGLRRVGMVLGSAGIVLVLIKLLSGTIVKHIENAVFNNSSSEQIHLSLINFINQAESQLVKVYLWFGIAYLLLAIIIFVVLRSGRERKPKNKAAPAPEPVSSENNNIADRLRGGSHTSTTSQTTAKPLSKDSKKPPRRLIQ